MGWFGDVIDTVKGWLSIDIKSRESKTIVKNSVSNTQTIYEPDKVKVAELENKRMEKAIEAQKEIIKMNQEMQLLIIEAHQKGFEQSVETLKEMMTTLNQIEQERLMLIENGHYEIVKKIENLYMELEKEIREDNDKFNMEQLPKMLEMLNKFEKDSQSAKLYEKSIDRQIELNAEFFMKKLNALHVRQRMMIESTIKSKELILGESSQIVIERMQFLEKQLETQKSIPILSNTKLPELPHQHKELEAKIVKE